jgi:hypothetical protein
LDIGVANDLFTVIDLEVAGLGTSSFEALGVLTANVKGLKSARRGISYNVGIATRDSNEPGAEASGYRADTSRTGGVGDVEDLEGSTVRIRHISVAAGDGDRVRIRASGYRADTDRA